MLVLVVPSEGIADAHSKRVAPYFVAEAGVPAEYLGLPYGFIVRKPKGDMYINPWKLAAAVQSGQLAMKQGLNLEVGPEDGIGDDGVLRWEMSFGRGSEQLVAGGIDAVEGSLVQLLTQGGQLVVPDAIALTTRHDLGDIRAACAQLSVETVVIDYDGQLALDRQIN